MEAGEEGRATVQVAPPGTVRVIYFALIGGVIAFVVIAGATTGWGARAAGGDASIFPWVWVALAIATFPAVLFFRGIARKAAGLDAARRMQEREIDAARVQTSLIVAWALVEGPALFGVVIFFMFGRVDILAYALAVAAVGWAVTFPSREYFEAERGHRLR